MDEFTLPDYRHGSVNLMAALSQALGGGATGYAPLPGLAAEAMQGRPVVLLVIDGLGAELLQRHPDTFLARHRVDTLSAVFPSTTASAITTFTTGMAPQQHAITGWHLWLRELGSVATILPFVPRFGGPPFSRYGYSPRDFIGAPPLFDRLAVPVEILSPDWIVNSDYNRASGGGAPRHGFRTVAELLQQVERLVSDGAPRLVYGYWPELDALAHAHGVASTQVTEQLHALDAALAAWAPRLAARGALLLVTADHGLIDTDAAHTLQVSDHPPLAEALAIPLCGEPRTAFCYLRRDSEASCLAYLRAELGHACEVVASAELVAQGYFGLGAPHRELASRVGDYTLLMKGRYVMRQRLAHEKPFQQIGVHGGLSRDEMAVPLCRLSAD